MLLPLFLLPLALAEGLPAVTLRQGRHGAWLEVVAPPGEHVNAEAPSRLRLDMGSAALDRQSEGGGLAWSAPLGLPSGALLLEGEVQLSLCTDSGDACRPVDLSIAGERLNPRGSVELEVAPRRPEPGGQPVPAEIEDLDAAIARAGRAGQLVLVDFSAVWCPPCNLMAAEVLRDPAQEGALEGVLVVTIDADRPESWAWKDRYKIGGYPTVLLLDGQGRELSRVVGYDGEGPFLDWLSRARAGSGAAASPALQARDRARAGQMEQVPTLLSQAAALPGHLDDPAFREARYHQGGSLEDAQWLCANAPYSPHWLYPLVDQARAQPALEAPARAAVQRLLPGRSPAEASELFALMSKLAPAEKALWSAAAARALEAALSREPAQDRGHWTSLAHLHADGGDLAAATRVLEEASRLYPEEMTWPHSLAGLLLEAGQAEAALPWAERALDCSYGDNRLRAAERLARVELALGHAPQALAVIEAALSGQPAPPVALEVRTHRYVSSLEALRVEVQRAAETKKWR